MCQQYFTFHTENPSDHSYFDYESGLLCFVVVVGVRGFFFSWCPITTSTKDPCFTFSCSLAYSSHFIWNFIQKHSLYKIHSFSRCFHLKQLTSESNRNRFVFSCLLLSNVQGICSLEHEPSHIYRVYLRQPASSRACFPKAKNNRAQWRTVYWEKDLISHVVFRKRTWLGCVDRCVCEPSAPNQFNQCLPHVGHFLLMAVSTIWLANTHR